ncbi:VanZ family protein [Sinomonas humi]|uniref:VanZ family protein n=1 Tax=Sinomonas humi TaxID=1338436 RepID=UPI0006920735|nr:VanZ family protein [Sinomonas humi]
MAAAANVAVFVPVGFLLAVLLRPGFRWAAVVLCFLLTTSIEIVQALLLPGRDGNARDIITNTLGGAIGAASCYVWLWLHRPSRRGPAPAELDVHDRSSGSSRSSRF